jgi:hypothetical protein
VPESKNFTTGSHGTVTLIRLIKFKGRGFKPEKSVAAASTGQGELNLNPIRTGSRTTFSKGGSIQFFNELCGFTIKSEYPDF